MVICDHSIRIQPHSALRQSNLVVESPFFKIPSKQVEILAILAIGFLHGLNGLLGSSFHDLSKG